MRINSGVVSRKFSPVFSRPLPTKASSSPAQAHFRDSFSLCTARGGGGTTINSSSRPTGAMGTFPDPAGHFHNVGSGVTLPGGINTSFLKSLLAGFKQNQSQQGTGSRSHVTAFTQLGRLLQKGLATLPQVHFPTGKGLHQGDGVYAYGRGGGGTTGTGTISTTRENTSLISI